MSIIDDLRAEAPRIEKEIELRGHKVIIKTLLGTEAAPYYKYVADNDMQLIADYNAATIAASIFTDEGERLPVDIIPHIRNGWTQDEIQRAYAMCEAVGNTLNVSEQEKKE